jgi:hypothetical protein
MVKEHPNLITESGDTIIGRIQQLMSSIENDIKECGKAIDTYRKQHLMGSFIILVMLRY